MKMRHYSNNSFKQLLSEPEVMYQSRQGVDSKRLYDLMSITGITLNEMGHYMHISPRTLQRKQEGKKLSPDVSERFLLIQNVYIRGSQVFSNLDRFCQWMDTPNIALSNSKPKDYLDTFTGIEYLMGEMGRIEHGILA